MGVDCCEMQMYIYLFLLFVTVASTNPPPNLYPRCVHFDKHFDGLPYPCYFIFLRLSML